MAEFEHYRVANERVRLEKESALADMVKASVVSHTIMNTEMQVRLSNESLQDVRIRTQGEYDLRMYEKKREIDIRLNNQESTNSFNLSDQALTNENERKMKMMKANTNSQVTLMETTSTCNRNQAIFNQFGPNDKDEEEEEEEDE